MAARRQLHDQYFRQAKAEGYLARSAYKLKEIDEKKRVLRPHDRVLDLGCAPGAWLQVVLELVGPRGVVAGVDLKPVEAPFPPNVRTLVADVYGVGAPELLALAGPDLNGRPRFDVVLSDMAPNTAGGAGGSADHFLSVRLCDRVLDLAPMVLRPGGNLVMKVFEGEAYRDLLDRTKSMFAEVKGFKPKASRDVSREMYIVATGMKAGV